MRCVDANEPSSEQVFTDYISTCGGPPSCPTRANCSYDATSGACYIDFTTPAPGTVTNGSAASTPADTTYDTATGAPTGEPPCEYTPPYIEVRVLRNKTCNLFLLTFVEQKHTSCLHHVIPKGFELEAILFRFSGDWCVSLEKDFMFFCPAFQLVCLFHTSAVVMTVAYTRLISLSCCCGEQFA